MKRFAIALIQLGLLIAPTFSLAQYFRITRGQPCPMDTCVAVDLTQYRRESAFMKWQQLLIDGQGSEINSLRSEINVADSVYQNLMVECQILTRANHRKDSTITVVSNSLIKTHDVAVDALKPPGFFERPGTWGVIGLIVGFIIAR